MVICAFKTNSISQTQIPPPCVTKYFGKLPKPTVWVQNSVRTSLKSSHKIKKAIIYQKKSGVIPAFLFSQKLHLLVEFKVLITANSDLVRPIEFIKENYPNIQIKIYFPPSSYSNDLRDAAKNRKIVQMEKNK